MDKTLSSSPPLAGIRVLDLARVLAGPWCTMTLADLGADVIKVENPAGGDDTRTYRPPDVGGESAFFLSCNRSKRSLALDFSKPEGQAVVLALVEKADVLVENYRFGALDAYHLGYETLRHVNPRLIYCSISGYGRVSPMAERASYDTVIQAESGLMSVTGEKTGTPVRVGVSIADLLTGTNATQSILAALLARERTGRGQFVDISLMDSAVAVMANQASAYFVDGQAPVRLGTQSPFVAPSQAFDASDGRFVVVIGNDRQFRQLCGAVGRPELGADQRFLTNALRLENRNALECLLVEAFRSDVRDAWLAKLHAAGLPAGAVRDLPKALASPEVLARGMVRTVTHPTAGEIRLVGSPLRFSETPTRAPFAPPLLGQHSRDILIGDLGFEPERVQVLEAAGVVLTREPDVKGVR